MRNYNLLNNKFPKTLPLPRTMPISKHRMTCAHPYIDSRCLWLTHTL